eukprot:5178411-Pleurochrysis_carterae.AAC.1
MASSACEVRACVWPGQGRGRGWEAGATAGGRTGATMRGAALRQAKSALCARASVDTAVAFRPAAPTAYSCGGPESRRRQ